MTHETARADEFQVLGAAVVALDDCRELAVDVEPREIVAHVVQKPRVTRAGGPRERLNPCEIEGDAQIRMHVVRQCEFRGIGNGVIDGSIRHPIEQRLSVRAGVFHPHQIGQHVARAI